MAESIYEQHLREYLIAVRCNLYNHGFLEQLNSNNHQTVRTKYSASQTHTTMITHLSNKQTTPIIVAEVSSYKCQFSKLPYNISFMLKKCTVLISAIPNKLLLTQKSFTRPLAYRFAFSAENTTKLHMVGNGSIEEQLLNLNNLSFSTFKIDGKEEQVRSEFENDETMFELSWEQKLYFMQAAGFLLVGNVLLRLSLGNDRDADSQEKKL